jgi:hypothetical protein
LSSKPSFQIYLVHSNPLYENLPRVFITKTKNEKIIWAYEIDEIQEVLFDNEFCLEEAEYLGTIESLDLENVAAILSSPERKEVFSIELTQKILWNVETLMGDHMVAKMGSVVYVARPKKFARSPEIDAAEQAEIKSKLQNLEFKNKNNNKKRHEDMFLDETEVEEYVLKNRKSSRGVYNSKNDRS